MLASRRIALAGALLGCPTTSTRTASPQARARSGPLDADALRGVVGSLGTGGGELLARLADDGWVVHHGTTEPLRERDAIAAYLTELHRAFPRLATIAGAPVRVGDEGWIVEIEVRDGERIASGRLVALIRTRRATIVSMEIFGPDPRDPASESGAPIAATADPALALQDEPSPAVTALARTIADRVEFARARTTAEVLPQSRLSARAGDLLFAVFVVVHHTERSVPLVRHVAALARLDGERIAEARLYDNPREGGVTEMGNLSGHRELLQSRVDGDALLWGAWLGFCCEQGDRTRACHRLSTRELDTCRAGGRLGLVCREAYHCTGAECFCCSNGLDAACSMDHVPDVEREIPKGRRPPEPSIWSPY